MMAHPDKPQRLLKERLWNNTALALKRILNILNCFLFVTPPVVLIFEFLSNMWCFLKVKGRHQVVLNQVQVRYLCT